MSHFLKSWSWTHSVVSCYLYTTIFALALPCQRSAISQRPTNNYVPTGESSLMKSKDYCLHRCSVKIQFSLPNTMDRHMVHMASKVGSCYHHLVGPHFPARFSATAPSGNGHGWALDNPVRTTTQWLTPTALLGTQTFRGFSRPIHVPPLSLPPILT